MIIFKNPINQKPYSIFKEKYDEANKLNQKNIEAIAISSYDLSAEQVDSRFVNLKFIDGKEFIFFTNYNSPKSIAFASHEQISALIYWASSNTQIRIKAKIKKTSKEYNNNYFKNRAREKNALAISSDQSKPIDSYSQVKQNFNKSLKTSDLTRCPEYWGGYAFTPYYFEFWEGESFRLNKREVFEKKQDIWNHYVLQP